MRLRAGTRFRRATTRRSPMMRALTALRRSGSLWLAAAADRCGARRLPNRRRSPVRGLRHRPARGAGALYPADVRPAAHQRVAAGGAGRARAAARRSAGLRRRRRLRRGTLQHGDRARLPEAARRHLAGSGLEERVEFHRRDAADEELAGNYDLVYIHEALHDMSYPVEVLGACRRLLADGGSLIVGDERVHDTFDPPGDEIERFYYGCSILHCLPVGMVGENAAGTGTVMRADTVRGYAEQAGFSHFEILPIENDFYRFYLMS